MVESGELTIPSDEDDEFTSLEYKYKFVQTENNKNDDLYDIDTDIRNSGNKSMTGYPRNCLKDNSLISTLA